MSYNLLPVELKKSRLVEKLSIAALIVLFISVSFVFLFAYDYYNYNAEMKYWETKKEAMNKKNQKLEKRLNSDEAFNSFKDSQNKWKIAQRVKLEYNRYDYILSLVGELTPKTVLINRIKSDSKNDSITLEGQAKDYQSLVNYYEILTETDGIYNTVYESIVYDNLNNVINFKIKFFLKKPESEKK